MQGEAYEVKHDKERKNCKSLRVSLKHIKYVYLLPKKNNNAAIYHF